MQDTLVPFASQRIEDNCRYQDDSATPRRSRVMTNYLQQEDITKMDQPVQIPWLQPLLVQWGGRLTAIVRVRGGNTRYWPISPGNL